MQHLVVEPCFFRFAIVEQKNAIFDGHEAIPSSIDEKQSCGWEVNDATLNETEVLLCIFEEICPIFVSILEDVGMTQDEGVFMIIHMLEPLLGEKEMSTSTLSNTTYQTRMMSMSDADGIIATCRQAPGQDFGRVKPRLGLDPIEDCCEQSIWGFWVFSICRAIGGSWNLRDDGRPSTFGEFVGSLAASQL